MSNTSNYQVFAFTVLVLLMCCTGKVFAKECASLSATGNSEYPPYLWRADEKSDHLVGAINIVITELAMRLKRSIDLKHVGSWSRAQEEVRTGRVDMIAGAFYTVPRNQWMDYVFPAFLNTNSVVWKNRSRPLAYSKKEDLMGKLGVTVINNSFGQDFDEFAKEKLKIEYVASLEQAFRMLSLNRVDYALYEQNPGLAYASTLGFSKDIVHMLGPISQEGLYLTISHNSKCNTGKLRGEVAKHIRAMVSEGFTAKALENGLELWNINNRPE